MKKPLQAGDRVRVYQSYPYSGVVIERRDPDFISIEADGFKGTKDIVHVKQCRRLVQKKKQHKIWWGNIRPGADCGAMHDNEADALAYKAEGRITIQLLEISEEKARKLTGEK